MSFIEFLKPNKDKDTGSDQNVLPLHANRNVAKLFEQKMRRDSEPSETINSTKNTTKRSSKSEENIFEKIEKNSGNSVTSNGNCRYGTLPKSKLSCNSDKEVDNNEEKGTYEYQKKDTMSAMRVIHK
uniref:CSON014768 protein n=1 Tax=Culicoides sonorensis TaxID=179676 RepID=A0A336MBP9_CULSO